MPNSLNFTVNEVELQQLKLVFPSIARRTTPSPTLRLAHTEMPTKHTVAQHFTRAVIYPLYSDPDILVCDMRTLPQPSDLPPSPAVDLVSLPRDHHDCTPKQKPALLLVRR